MKTQKNMLLVFVMMELCACVKSVTTHDVIRIAATSPQLMADQFSKDTFYAFLPDNAVADKRAVTFVATTGLFDNGKDTMTVLANRTDIRAGQYTAVVGYTSSLRAGFDTIIAKTIFSPPYADTVVIALTPSVADSIALAAGGFSVKSAFGSEITLTGNLFNASGNKVSIGNKVVFSDTYADGSSVGGSFRQVNDQSDSNAQVSAIYSPGLVTAGLFIYIKATIVDGSGAPGSSAIVKIYVTS